MSNIQKLCDAAHSGDIEGVQAALAEGVDVNSRTDIGMTPLMCAAKNGHRGVVRALLGRGASTEAVGSKDGPFPVTALYLAAAFGAEHVIDELLDAGASIESSDEDGFTPLLVAASRGREGIVRRLIRAGANLEATTSNGETPLMLASQTMFDSAGPGVGGDLGTVKVLVAAGADHAHADLEGNTALTLAERARCEDIMEFLRTLS